MCGIVGYIGEKQAYQILIKGLKRLEYRGYDSSGVALINGDTNVYKCKGKIKNLEEFVSSKNITGSIGIGHTRWATHGEPNDVNSHPHVSENKEFTIVHNGIIENYAKIKQDLTDNGYSFKSETDTEVLANLIEYVYFKDGKKCVEEAVRIALSRVVGAYGLVIASKSEPDKLIAVRKSSPLVVGLGDGEYFLASDASPIVEYTDKVVYLNNDDIAIITKDELLIKNSKRANITPKVQTLKLTVGEIEKEGYDHFMQKEIFEQPYRVFDTFRGRINPEATDFNLGGIHQIMPDLVKAKRVLILACGTSWHAGLLGEYMIEEYARIPVEVEYASEFRYRNPIVNQDDIVMAISQSGETADTLAAIAIAKDKGAKVVGVCNVVGSTLSRESDAGLYTHAGAEIGVASTKAFTTQVTALVMIALKVGFEKGVIETKRYHELIAELKSTPDKIKEIFEQDDKIKSIANGYKDATDMLYLGRNYQFPIALEGALKLKEISYIHAEGYPAAEMKHGPIALIEDGFPVVVVATKDPQYEKVLSNIQEVKARGGSVLAIVTKGDTEIAKAADNFIEVPESDYTLAPLLSIIPLQIFSYYIAVLRDCNVDQPRNLAKSVTVE